MAVVKKENHKRKRSSISKKNSPFNNISMSNYDLSDWCKYLSIPINDVLSRDKNVPHNHIQAIFVLNLEPSCTSGSHWVATSIKNDVIDYFDSFGMPPFQELVKHAKTKNLTLLHQNHQIQNLLTAACGYFFSVLFQ